MLKVGIREIIRLLKNSGICFLISQVDGSIEYCDRKIKKLLIGSKRGLKLENTQLNQYIEVVYPHSENIIPESLNFWMQIWKIIVKKETKKKEKPTEDLGAFGIRIKQGENVPDKVLFLIFPISKEESVSKDLREPGLTYLLKVIKELPLLVLQIDSLGNIVYVNDRIKDLIGWLPSEVRGRNWFEVFVPEEIREETIQFLQASKQEIGNAISFEGEILTKDSQRLLMLWACLNLEGEKSGSSLFLMLGQELNTPRLTKFLTRGIRLLKNQLQWIYEDLVCGIPEEEAFSEVIHNVVEITSLEAAAVFKVVSKNVILISSEGLEVEIKKSLKEISLDNVVIETIMLSNDVVEISPLMDSFPINLQEKGFVKVFAVPIRIGENPVGFFALATTRKDRLEEEIIPLLDSIACEMGWIFLWYNIQGIHT
ncbi:MAG TPA: PAS domain S-box protein [Candidatus Hydrogenedens sp.]|nr:PAS domain S-box protein [Candidatus Hydrogenedens sp.]